MVELTNVRNQTIQNFTITNGKIQQQRKLKITSQSRLKIKLTFGKGNEIPATKQSTFTTKPDVNRKGNQDFTSLGWYLVFIPRCAHFGTMPILGELPLQYSTSLVEFDFLVYNKQNHCSVIKHIFPDAA